MNNNCLQNQTFENQAFESQATSKSSMGKVLLAASAGFAGIAIVPVTVILSVTFSLVGVALPIISITNLLGMTFIPFNIGPMLITGLPQIIVAFVTGILFLLGGGACFKGLKSYLKMVKNIF